MDHSEFERLMPDYCLNMLPEEILISFGEHMIACSTCRKKVFAMEIIVSKLKEKSVAGIFAEQGVDLKVILENKLKEEGCFEQYKPLVEDIFSGKDKKGSETIGQDILPKVNDRIDNIADIINNFDFCSAIFSVIKSSLRLTVQPALSYEVTRKSEKDFIAKIQIILTECLFALNDEQKNILIESFFYNKEDKIIAEEMKATEEEIAQKKSKILNEIVKLFNKKITSRFNY